MLICRENINISRKITIKTKENKYKYTINQWLTFQLCQQINNKQSLRYWQTRTHCCLWCFLGWANWETFVADTKCFWTKSATFLCPGHKICVRNKCCTRGQTEKHLCRQQCVRNNVSSLARAFNFEITEKDRNGLWYGFLKKTSRCQFFKGSSFGSSCTFSKPLLHCGLQKVQATPFVPNLNQI